MRKIYSMVLIIAVALGFSACGGGGDSSYSNANVDISIKCVATPSSNDFDSYITLYSGDEIVNDEANTKVTTYHNINGEKKVCLNTGSAHIVRK